MTYEKWKQNWRIGRHDLRLGQAFVNEFFSGLDASTRELYYQPDYWECDLMIVTWLVDNQHYPNVPDKRAKK